MKNLIFSALLLTSLTALAQIQKVNQSINELVYFVNINTSKYDVEAEGSPYLNPEFVPSKINDIKETSFVRLNAIDNAIELKKGDGSIVSLSQSYQYKIRLLDGSNKTYETQPYMDTEEGTLKNSFFEVLEANEKFTLYVKERILYKPGKKSESSYEQDKPGRFIKGHTLFYVKGFSEKSEALVVLPRKKKKFLNVFKNQSKTVEKYMKKENLGIDEPKDLIKILDFYFQQA